MKKPKLNTLALKIGIPLGHFRYEGAPTRSRISASFERQAEFQVEARESDVAYGG